MNIKLFLAEHRLHINESVEKSVINTFCSTTTTGSRKRLLENWFEGYIYCATLGMAKGRRKPFGKGQKTQKAQWSNSYLSQYEFLICQVLTRQDVLVDLGLWTDRKNTEAFDIVSAVQGRYSDGAGFEEQIFFKRILLEAKVVCDEYMNGGLDYLEEKMKEGVVFTDQLDTLVAMFR